MPVFMKYDGIDGRFSHADTFDFSLQTTELTAPAEEVHHSEFSIVKLLDAASPKLFIVDEGPEETVAAGGNGGTVANGGNGGRHALGDTSAAYEGTHVLYQDIQIPSLETDPSLL